MQAPSEGLPSEQSRKGAHLPAPSLSCLPLLHSNLALCLKSLQKTKTSKVLAQNMRKPGLVISTPRQQEKKKPVCPETNPKRSSRPSPRASGRSACIQSHNLFQLRSHTTMHCTMMVPVSCWPLLGKGLSPQKQHRTSPRQWCFQCRAL